MLKSTLSHQYLSIAAALFAVIPLNAQVNAASKKYTTNADFALGSTFNLQTTPADQLQIATVTSTFNLMWIANAGEDTVSKIDTTTGKELARYRTFFNGGAVFPPPNHGAYSGAAPSRTAVDSDGNVYIANRHFDGRPPSIMKILAAGGIDRNGNSTIDTSTDLDNSGTINALAELPNLLDTNGNGTVDVAEIQDERIAWFRQLPAAANNGLGRSLSIDPDGNIWVGQYNQQNYYKLDGTTGAILGGPYALPGGHTPYGSAIDANKFLWGASLSNNLLKFNTATPGTLANHTTFAQPASNYGIALGQQAGVLHVYTADLNGLSYQDHNTQTNVVTRPAAVGARYSGRGVGTDGSGNIYVGHTNGIVKFATSGAVLWQAGVQPGFAAGEGYGVVVDADQNAWLISGPGLSPGRIAKYNGTTGAFMGVFPVGAAAYTYSDASGIGRFTSQPQGRFTVTQTAGIANNAWKMSWNSEPQGNVPVGSTLLVEARTAATQIGLDSAVFAAVPNGGSGCVQGEFIEVRATLSTTTTTPVLSDLTIGGKCDVNGDGKVSLLDINAINSARNTPSSGACDARDADANGIINVNDSRQCVLKCTNASCAN